MSKFSKIDIQLAIQLYKSKYGKYFLVKRNTMMLLYMYQVISSLQGHRPYFLHFYGTVVFF